MRQSDRKRGPVFAAAMVSWLAGGGALVPAVVGAAGGPQWAWQNPLPQGNTLQDVAFVDGQTAFAVGAHGTIVRSTDGGASWEVLETGTRHDLYAVEFLDPSTGTAVGNFGVILRTNDGGESWAVQRETTSGVLWGVAFTDPDTGTAVGSEGLIVRTTDGGATWLPQVSGTGAHLLDVAFTDGDRGTAVGESGTILHTNDGGATWTAQASGTDTILEAVSFTDGDTGTVVGWDSTVLRTVDGGNTWTPQTIPVTSDIYDVEFVDASTGIATGPIGLVLRTADGGATWTQEFPGSLQILYAVSYADADELVIVGFAGEILTSSDGGASWTVRSSGTKQTLSGVSFTTPLDGVAVGGFGLVLHTEDGGDTWTQRPTSTFSQLNEVVFADPATVIAVGEAGAVLRSTDGGLTWAEQDTGSDALLFGVAFADADLGLAVGGQGTILRTTNGGVNWTAVDSGTGQFLFGVAFGGDDTAVAVGFGGTILRSADGGTSWTAQASGVASPLRGVTFTGPQNVTAVGNDSTILQSSDGGVTWQPRANPGEDHFWDVSFAHPDLGFVAGDGGSMLRTTDGGVTWVPENTGTFHSIFDLFLVDPDTATAVGDLGTILKRLPQKAPSALVFDPPALAFGEVPVGSTSDGFLALLSNTGEEAATGLMFTLEGAAFDFEVAGCGSSLPAGASCALTVWFMPQVEGPAAGSIEATADGGLTASLGLSGVGVSSGGGFVPAALTVDALPDLEPGNGVFEPGETVEVAPAWQNVGSEGVAVVGVATGFGGPEGADYTVVQEVADYGFVAGGAVAGCRGTGVCFVLEVDNPGQRPAAHWDASFEETLEPALPSLSGVGATLWTLHLGGTFVDVTSGNGFYRSVETLVHNGVSGIPEVALPQLQRLGCGGELFCPGGPATRAAAAVFLLQGLEGGDYLPPACAEGAELFADVPFDDPFCPWIEELAGRGATAGCGDGNFCPAATLNRAQVAVLLLRVMEGPGYTPPACNGIFGDVACPSTFAPWIEELAARGFTAGCSANPPAYCPGVPVNRGQTAAFVTTAFGLQLYGPVEETGPPS